MVESIIIIISIIIFTYIELFILRKVIADFCECLFKIKFKKSTGNVWEELKILITE